MGRRFRLDSRYVVYNKTISGSPHGRGRIGKLQIALFDRWAAGSGARPRKIFLIHFNEILKQILRTTRPTAPRWKAQIQIC